MLINRVPATNRLLSITPHRLQIVLAEDGRASLTLLLPPLEELAEIRNLSSKNVSLQESATETSTRLSENFSEELKKLLEKRDRFQKSATYLAHLANFAELARDPEQEHAFLAEGEKISGDVFFTHRRGTNLVARGVTKEAERLFRDLDLEKDVGANLRLAYLYVRREDLEGADEFVLKAIKIDPVDFGARMFKGALSLARGDSRQAIHNFRIALEERETSSLFTNLAIAHIRLGQTDKAFAALKRAIRIEPFNQNAVAVLADLAFVEKRNKEAVASLGKFLEFEQKNPSMWARLARALIESGNKQQALDALKRQASIEESSSVFNNIGVTYSQLGHKQRAAEYFSYAMRKAESDTEYSYRLAARNLLSTFAETERFIDLVTVGKVVLKTDTDFGLAHHRILSDIYTLFIYGIARAGKEQEAERFAKQLLLEVPDAHPSLRAWLMSGLVGALSLKRERWAEAELLAEDGLRLVSELDADDFRRDMLKSNAAFLYLEMGKSQEAARLLSEISKWIHKEPYPTATLGLLQVRKGRIEKGEALYREAMRLTRSTYDKDRIAQKMHLELGKKLIEVNKRLARRHLVKAVRDFPITDAITEEAKSVLAALPSDTLQ